MQKRKAKRRWFVENMAGETYDGPYIQRSWAERCRREIGRTAALYRVRMHWTRPDKHTGTVRTCVDLYGEFMRRL